jgi:hypothetical protein
VRLELEDHHFFVVERIAQIVGCVGSHHVDRVNRFKSPPLSP